MSTFRIHRTALFSVVFLSIAVLSVGVGTGHAQDLSASLLPLKPMAQDRTVAQTFILCLETSHISRRTLDPSVSKEALRLYIKTLDPRKMYFYQSDIDEFRAKYESRLCELLKQKPVDVQPAFDIYNRYLDRLKERVEMVQKILATPIDFTMDEEYVVDKMKDFTLDENIIKAKGLQGFAKTTEEAYDRWRKRIKSELLDAKTDAVISEQKREKALAEGKEPPEVDQRDPVERVRKRFISLQRQKRLEGRIESVEILENVRRQAHDEVLEQFLSAISGALDPHSDYMSPSTERQFVDDMTKNFEGIGATLSSEDEYIVVRGIVKGGPAEKSGEIHPNDKIRGVGQGKEGKIEEVIDFKVIDVVKLIRGPKDTIVRLEILPDGRTPSKIVEIVRDTVTLEDQAVQRDIFEVGRKADGTPHKVGFIQLPGFYRDTGALQRREPGARSATSDTKKILKELVENNVDVVVLDLRYNGGGSLEEAIELTGLFLGSGVVVQVKDEVGSRPRPRANSDPSCDWTGPLVVVTNKFSASASEIFAGAIKDYRRGLIVGDSTTLGKGTVQHVIDLSERIMMGGGDFGLAKITIQGFYRPSGITTQGIGVAADIVLPSGSDVREGITEAELDNALSLKRVDAVIFTPKQYVTPQIVAELKRRSDIRIRESEDFTKLLDQIVAYKDSRSKRVIPLNEAKYLEEEKRSNSSEWEREELEDLFSKEKKIRRNFYVDEVLAITVDYLNVAQESGVMFPTERTVQPPRRSSWFGLGF